MSVSETLDALKVRVHDTSAEAVAKEAEIHPDTLRAILGPKPPKWLQTFRRLEEMVRPAST